MTALLAPLGAVFGGATALRASLYRRGFLARARLRSPVISIGNLAVGGRGKTPLVELAATMLRDAGRPVAVLSRGYGGAFRGDVLVVGDGVRVAADVAEAGDEPVMLARALPGVVVAVGRDRVAAGRALETALGPRVFVLDDGFQHLRLLRDLDVVCVDASDLRARPLPAGLLRERPSALSRAHLIAVSGEDEDDARAAVEALSQRFGPDRIFRVRRVPAGFVDLAGAPAPAPARAYLLTGIARPERVATDLAARGTAVTGHAAFADHHRFRGDEIEAVLRAADRSGADAVVTTAKDAVRLPATMGARPVLVWRVRCAVEDEERFRARLLAVGGGA
ncbi:MAG TPA: tetraacyldisaccharide 4'-kinase [Vicinamibacteria bacterium]|nr:tetraacyldisaccharide 4'-kinase [Vicinamibacteria bacterium]